MARIITLAEAQAELGQDTVIVLEGDEDWEKKVKGGKEDQAWVFDLAQGAICRGDRKFYEFIVGTHPGGYPAAFVREEPGIPAPADGGKRVVGHVIVDVDSAGNIAVRRGKGLNGETLEVKSSSVSKGELDASGQQPVGYVEFNPMRLDGFAAVYVNRVDAFAAGVESMSPRELAEQSTDGRLLSALAKAGLFK